MKMGLEDQSPGLSAGSAGVENVAPLSERRSDVDDLMMSQRLFQHSYASGFAE
jgi:hypothetical protein